MIEPHFVPCSPVADEHGFYFKNRSRPDAERERGEAHSLLVPCDGIAPG